MKKIAMHLYESIVRLLKSYHLRKISEALVDLTKTIQDSVYYYHHDGFSLEIYFDNTKYTVELTPESSFIWSRSEEERHDTEEMTTEVPLPDNYYGEIYEAIRSHPPASGSLEFTLETPRVVRIEGNIAFNRSTGEGYIYCDVFDRKPPALRDDMDELSTSWYGKVDKDVMCPLIYRIDSTICSMRAKEIEHNRLLNTLDIPLSSRGEQTRKLLDVLNLKKNISLFNLIYLDVLREINYRRITRSSSEFEELLKEALGTEERIEKLNELLERLDDPTGLKTIRDILSNNPYIFWDKNAFDSFVQEYVSDKYDKTYSDDLEELIDPKTLFCYILDLSNLIDLWGVHFQIVDTKAPKEEPIDISKRYVDYITTQERAKLRDFLNILRKESGQSGPKTRKE
ncbi:MAG: hypothetical protein H0Z28_11950 [Archaeoglobus sp.]|nr:hypothetical protein [Archaeoglobus sp.]